MAIELEKEDFQEWSLSTQRETKYPFPSMAVGDWFKIPEGTMIKSVRVAASYWNAKYNGERHFKVYSQQRAVRRVK